MKNDNRVILIRILLTITVIIGSLYLLTRLMMPKYDIGVIEGAMVSEYYAEVKDHDLIFIGDCEVYENFSPAVLFKDYGINSYIRGSAQQLIWQSYYMLEDTLRYEEPAVVIFNVLSLMYNEPQREAYNRMSIEGMRWSSAKAGAINASMTERENFLDYVFPLLRYHSRWRELDINDLTHIFRRDKVTHNGFFINIGVKPAINVPEGRILGNYNFGDKAWRYLEKITALCQANDIELILVKAPSLYPYWYEEWEEQIIAYARENDLKYLNFLNLIEETGLDFMTDTHNAGLHLNLSGAEKITHYLGEFLINETNLTDRRSDERLLAIWKEKITAYDEEIAAKQLRIKDSH
ncbi:MAG: SGNH/GDSL hydrolase family protein [Lachnospiraceae bacterium]|nr:SGNH/GDSL hydrolase family protein [Lachnospiraceae bacterium]